MNPNQHSTIMKKLFLLIAGLGFLAAIIGCLLGLTAKKVFADERFFAQRVKGSGRIVTRMQEVPACQAFEAARSVDVIVTGTESRTARIDADDNLIDKVIVTVEEGKLKVGIDRSVKDLRDCHVSVTAPHPDGLRSLVANSAAQIRCKQPLTAAKTKLSASSAARIVAAVEATECKIDASSAAMIEATVKATDCDIETSSASQIEATVNAAKCDIAASSASKIEIEGTAQECEADLSSASKLTAKNFAVQHYDIETSSGSSARIRCTERLQAKASSGSLIRYSGRCETRISKSSGGSVHAE